MTKVWVQELIPAEFYAVYVNDQTVPVLVETTSPQLALERAVRKAR